jgi:predicted dehydrogenase
MIKIGVIGTGHLGKIHIKCILELKDKYELVGIFDLNTEQAEKIALEVGVKKFDNVDTLIDTCDALDIVTPTLFHFEYAEKCIKKSKHLFIEKPLTETVEQGKRLLDLSEEANVKVQVGHVERFNPAFVAVESYFKSPMFIECHRLAQFNPRGTDVSVVLDLMIHDLDIILNVVKSNVKKISANGVSVVSDSPDIANARIEFDNGCVANLTASRISLKNMRKTRFFQKDAYISVDFLDKESIIVKLDNAAENPQPFDMVIELGEGKGNKRIQFDKPEIKPTNAIKDELSSLYDAIINNTRPVVSLEDGYKALLLAHQIIQKVKISSQII